ncbi:uncharacterized protein isoform X1 [Leptinotarsa decemlineata]|uniref:uncharacterized protein isoform X1 n=2 Tax=Leptinotarsa decemlineata TaxID=7539 RepID=UPI003D308F78
MQFTEWKYGTRGTGASGLLQPGYQQYPGNVQYHNNVYQSNNPNQGKYKFGCLIDQDQKNRGYEGCDSVVMRSITNSNQIKPSHATATRQTEANRVTKFILPFEKDQNPNVYVDTSPMSNCNSNQMVPIFQSTNGYNGMGKMSSRKHYLQAISDPPANQYNSSLMVPPLPNTRRNVCERHKTSDESATGLQLSTPPRSRPVSSVPREMKTESMLSLVPDDTQYTGGISNLNCKIFGSSVGEKIFVFTGSVEKVMKWNKIFRNHFCFFEVIASIVSIQEGSVKTQKVMLLRDKKGPVLQVVYYRSTHLDLRDFYIGQMIRCIGRMSGQNVLNAESIRCASPEEVDNLQRLCLVCDQAVSHYLNV